ncbi:hypothetical protein MASR1M101_27930 [Gemmatimonas sp.]
MGNNSFKYRLVYLSTAVPFAKFAGRAPPRAIVTHRMFRTTLLLLCWLLVLVPHAEAQSTVPPVAEARKIVDSLAKFRDKPTEQASAMLQLARAFRNAAQPDSAGTAYRAAVDLATKSGDRAIRAEALLASGIHLLSVNQYDSALTQIQQARSLRLELGDSIGVWRTWNNTGAAHYQLGNYEQALNAFSEALVGRRREQDTIGIARVLTNIGKVYQDWGQHARAEARLLEAVAMARASGDPGVLGYALHTLSQVYVDTRKFDTAYRTINASIASYAKVNWNAFGNDSTGGWRLNATVRGEALVREGRAREAIPVLDSVVELGRQRNDIRSQAKGMLLLGEAYAALGNAARARELLSRSVELSKSVEQRVFTLQALERLSEVEEQAGDARASLRALRVATALRDTIFNRSTAERLAAEESREERERQQYENASLREAQQVQAAVIARQRLVVLLILLVLGLGSLLIVQLVRFNRLGRAREDALAKKNEELSQALNDVRTLSGLIPICASCKRVRDDRGYWQAVESYISSHSDATFSHAICQSCGPELYGELWPSAEEPAPKS